MTRYRPLAATWDHGLGEMILMPESMEVHEGCKAPKDTGLVDQNGTPLYRIEATVRFGFQKGD